MRIWAWIGVGRFLALVLLTGLLAVRIVDPAPVKELRFVAFDLFQKLGPREVAPVPVTILDIDDPSIARYGQWPWPRTRVADLVLKTFGGGAVAMGFDIVFAEPDRLSPPAIARDNPGLPEAERAALSALPDNDTVLAEAIARTRIVLGQTSVRSAHLGLDGARVIRPVPHAILGQDARPFLQHFPDLLQNLPALEEAAAGRGVFSVRPDADGIHRRIPVAMMVEDTLRLGLAPELLRVATGGNAFALRGNAAGVDGVILGGQLVRTAADGTVWPHFSPSSPARYISAGDLLDGTVPPERLRGQLVLLGTSAIGLEDFRATPLGTAMAGVEIHAQLLENILTDSLLVRPNYAPAVELVTLATLGLLVIALVPIMGAGPILASAGVVIVGYLGLTWVLFDSQRLLLDPTWPALSTVVMLMVMTTANYLREERQRRQIRSAFGQYVSPDLVQRLADDPEELTLGGERRELTLLFSDVRGFTTLAEGYRDDPTALTALMNSFLTVLSDEILREAGTIDKFMGDAVMAFWNAPLDCPDHPQAACRAALNMQAAVARLNAARLADDAAAAPIDVGLGLNSGPCTVGNMGSETRFDYTALGDAVNLASRLEGQSKAYGLGIILGESTAHAVRDEFAVIELDLLRVKGKVAPEHIYGLLGDGSVKDSAGFAAVQEANSALRSAYQSQEWGAADEAADAVEASGQDAGIALSDYASMYRARIAELRDTTPGPDWDGVHVATSK